MSLIESVISAQDNYVFNKLKLARLMAEQRRFDDYEARDRLSVSSFEGFECCPKTLIKDRMKPRRFSNVSLPKLAWGTAMHEVLQQFAMDTPNLTALKPWNFPLDDPEYRDKLDEIWPEIPMRILDPERSLDKKGRPRPVITGYADGVINYFNDMAVVDYKTNNDEEVTFKNRFWEKIHQKKYEFQVGFYLHMIQEQELWKPLRPKYWRLVYLNTRFQVGDDGGEKEVAGQLDSETKDKYNLIVDEAIRLFRDSTCECRYDLCNRKCRITVPVLEGFEAEDGRTGLDTP